jgi:hypothetical protein
VLVEYGGSGGRAAGPIANQIVRALQHEGYLPGEGGASLSGTGVPPVSTAAHTGGTPVPPEFEGVVQ